MCRPRGRRSVRPFGWGPTSTRWRAPADVDVSIEGGTSINPCDGDAFFSYDTTSTSAGTWAIDIVAQGGDILENRWANVRVADEDGDRTQVGFNEPNFGVELWSDQIGAGWRGWWDAHASVDVTISETDDTELFSGSAGTGRFGEFALGYDVHGIDLRPGMRVAISDGDDSVELTLLAVSWDTLDTATGLATGFAPVDLTPCVGGELHFGEDAGKGLWPIELDTEGNWRANLDEGAGLPPGSGGSMGLGSAAAVGHIGFGTASTVATYLPPGQAVTELRNVVTTLVDQHALTRLQGANLQLRLGVAALGIRLDLDSAAVAALQGFNRQVERYVAAARLDPRRATKLTGDASTVIATIRAN